MQREFTFRRTQAYKIGSFVQENITDEIPQLLNVLKAI
jgi:lipopolysaccharide/colanic/teichoic acid biosynthesis glycosyltransferase